MKRKQKKSFEKFIQKVFLQTAAMMAISVLVVAFVYIFIWRGNISERIVAFFETYYALSPEDAFLLYHTKIRQNFVLLFLGAVAVTFVLLLRISLNRLTRYFESINEGIDSLIKDDGEVIKLLPEMESIEHKLNSVRDTLEKRERDAKLSEQRKNDLVMYLAHDIKTPLTSVIGYLTLLHESPELSTVQKAEYVRISLEKANRLEQLIEEFFEITLYNLQTITVSKEIINLYYLLEQLVDEFYPQLQESKKKVIFQADELLAVKGDPDKLARVFANLLKNAIAYSDPASTITIDAKSTDKQVVVAITNKGAIPKEYLSSIFDKFYRLDEARTSHTGGSGLGLAVAQEIVTLHEGTIQAASEKGMTTFKVTLQK